jgi:hypothetical protein
MGRTVTVIDGCSNLAVVVIVIVITGNGCRHSIASRKHLYKPKHLLTDLSDLLFSSFILGKMQYCFEWSSITCLLPYYSIYRECMFPTHTVSL